MSVNENLYSIFERHFPDDRAPALELPDGATYSYGQLRDASGRYARLFRDLGVTPGDRIAAQAEKSPQALFAYLGCLRAGAVYLPLNPAYRAAEIAYFLADAEPRVFISAPARASELKDAVDAAAVAHFLDLDEAGRGTLFEAAMASPADAETAERQPDDVAAICYTSGTTGRPKGAMLTHRNLSSNALTLHRLWGFAPGDVLLHALPIFHVHGLFVAVGTALLNGSKMIFMSRFDAAQVQRHLSGATVMMGVPTFYTRLLADPAFDASACRNMRLFVSGSAPLLASTFNAFRERTGHAILERYGMTEAGMITSNPLSGERRAGTVGFALPGVEVRVADSAGRELAPEEIGVLEVRGPNVFKGYWRKPEKTAEDMRSDGFFVTGDNAFMDADGYVHIVGRSKDLVITGGYNVYPKEVELVIDAVEGVRESAVFGVPDADYGEAVVAAVVANANGPALTEASIQSLLRDRLAGFKVPKVVCFVDELPRNTMGKVQKNVLRDRFGDVRQAVGHASNGPR